MNALIPSEDLRLLVAHFPARKVEQVRLWCEVCEAFLATPSAQRAAVAKRLATEYAGRITGGLSLKSIYRRAAEYARQGWRGLVPTHALKVATGTAAGIGANEAFLLHWHDLVAANQRVALPLLIAPLALLLCAALRAAGTVGRAALACLAAALALPFAAAHVSTTTFLTPDAASGEAVWAAADPLFEAAAANPLHPYHALWEAHHAR